jgi:small multidrug resistance family-3 protein
MITRARGRRQPSLAGTGRSAGASEREVPGCADGGAFRARISAMNVARSIGLFIAAGLAEIGGGYLIWRWLREGAPVVVGVAGAIILVVYGVIPTLQRSSDFGRIYAAYGGVFVVASLLWGWGVNGMRPDRYDWTGAAVVLAGVGIIYFAPR